MSSGGCGCCGGNNYTVCCYGSSKSLKRPVCCAPAQCCAPTQCCYPQACCMPMPMPSCCYTISSNNNNGCCGGCCGGN